MGKKADKRAEKELKRVAKIQREIDPVIQRAGERAKEMASLKVAQEEDYALIKEAFAGIHGDFLFGRIKLRTSRNAQLNKERVTKKWGDKAKELIVTAASFKKLGLSEAEAKTYYDEGLPKVELSYIND